MVNSRALLTSKYEKDLEEKRADPFKLSQARRAGPEMGRAARQFSE